MIRKRWVAAAALAASAWAAPTASAETIYGLTDGNDLVVFDSATPGTVSAPLDITGLNNGEAIVGIDVRPATLQLYALSSTGRLLRVNPITGAATAAGSAPANQNLNGTSFDIDFNPVVDRLRIVSDADQNLRSNPNTGGAPTVDGPLNPSADVTGAAYTNNAPVASQPDGPDGDTLPDTPTTTLFDIDTTSDQLFTQNPPNNGTLTDPKPLGVNLVGDVGFDISTTSGTNGAYGTNTAYLVGRTADTLDRLYTVNTTSGAATAVGEVGGASKVKDIAVAAPVPLVGVLLSGAGNVGPQRLVFYRADLPGTAIGSVELTGLPAGQRVVGIDRRPATGAVFGITNGDRIITINPATGATTVVGAAAIAPGFNLMSVAGFDFNPVVDRIRVVNGTANGRVNPDTGARADTAPADGNLAYAGGDPNAGQTPGVTAAAYTNPVANATVTALFDLDTTRDVLAFQDPPNAGTLNTVGPLGDDFTEQNGYDIVARFNQGFAALDPQGIIAPPALFNVNGFVPQPAPADRRTALIGELGGVQPLDVIQGMTVVTDNVLPAAPTPAPTTTPTPTPTYTVPTPTPTPTYNVKRKPRLTAKAKPRRDKRKPFVFRVQGRLVLPNGVRRSAGCKGTVRVVAKKSGKVVGRRRTGVKSTCKYKARVKLRKAGKRGTVKFQVQYLGSNALTKASARTTAKYGKKRK